MRSFYAFVFPALLPHGLALYWPQVGFDRWMAALFVVWLLAICIIARLQHAQAAMAKALELENARLIARLTSARDLALSANAAKTDFLANMSHELRTPLNAIIGFAEMMTAGMFGPIGNARHEPYARDILESGRHLLHIVDEVVDVARLESGRVDLNEEPVGFAALVEAAARLVAPQAEAGGLMLTVADTGIGIAPSDMPRVTVPHARLEHREHLKRIRAHKRDSGRTSTGLGLPLVKMLAELHGGRLEIESALGAGTTARVALPAVRVVSASW